MYNARDKFGNEFVGARTKTSTSEEVIRGSMREEGLEKLEGEDIYK